MGSTVSATEIVLQKVDQVAEEWWGKLSDNQRKAINGRKERALKIAKAGMVHFTDDADMFTVMSSSVKGEYFYTITLAPSRTCTCPDHQEAGALEDAFFHEHHLDPTEWHALAEKFERADRPHRAAYTFEKLARLQSVQTSWLSPANGYTGSSTPARPLPSPARPTVAGFCYQERPHALHQACLIF